MLLGAWVHRAMETSRRELLGDPVFRGGVAGIQAQRAARGSFQHLWDAEVSVYSQWGEDGILDFLCDAVDLDRPKVLELGCGDWRECNSRFLAEYRSAGVTMVDGRADLVKSVRALPAFVRTTLDPRSEWITPDSVGDLVGSARKLHGRLDIVSLDIDGNDYWVASRIDYTGVRIVVFEYQPIFGAERAVSVPRQDDFDRTSAHYSWLYYGASLRAFIDLMQARGFTFAGSNRSGNNAFFVADEFVDRLKLPLPDVEDLRPFVEWTVRESHDQSGHLTHLGARQGVRLIRDLPLIDVTDGSLTTVGDVLALD
jgi:hypothetical protein